MVPDPTGCGCARRAARPGSGRGADRGGLEAIAAQPLVRELRQGGRAYFTAKRLGHAESDILDQHDENVWRVVREALRLGRPLSGRVLQARFHHALAHRRRRKGKHEPSSGTSAANAGEAEMPSRAREKSKRRFMGNGNQSPMFFGGKALKVAAWALSFPVTEAIQGSSRWPTVISSLGSR